MSSRGRKRRRRDPASILFAIGFLAADIFVWWNIAGAGPASYPSARLYFLDVGQGDAELLVLPGDVKVMTDAGPDAKVLQSLAGVLNPSDTYIDLAVISHPERDHFGGYAALLEHYRIGAFLYNGRDAAPGDAAWAALMGTIAAKGIPLITVGQGDVVHYGSGATIAIVSPDPDFAQSAAINDTGIVELITTPGLRALLTADTGSNVEDALVAAHLDLRADILKVPHHGSKYASDAAFLRAVDPKVAVIEVGAKNSYGQPATSTLGRIASTTRVAVFRTDRDGTIAVSAGENGTIVISKSK